MGTERRKAKAVVVGGSIAGVSCAHALISAGWEVVVLEKSTGPTTGSPTGAGLGLNPLSCKVIQSWIGDSGSVYDVTVPITIDQMSFEMSSSSEHSYPSSKEQCYCKNPVVVKKSWTTDNPGRKFVACKFYDPETNTRGCRYFRWYDKDIVDWKRDVTNQLVLEKKLLGNEVRFAKVEKDRLEEINKRLQFENEKLRVKCNTLAIEIELLKNSTNRKGCCFVKYAICIVMVLSSLCLMLSTM